MQRRHLALTPVRIIFRCTLLPPLRQLHGHAVAEVVGDRADAFDEREFLDALRERAGVEQRDGAAHGVAEAM